MHADAYDGFARSYATQNATSLLNEYYNRPALLALAGDVRGLRCLDAGCGSGPLSAAWQEQGADVSAFDGSAAMVELARERLGQDAHVSVLDIADPLPYPDATFDVAAASLVLHYVEDWSGPLREFRRTLRPGGRLIVSVPHPLVRVFTHPDEDYFATRAYTEDYVFDGEPVTLTHWHRPLQAMTAAFTTAGFDIAVVSEPAPVPETPVELLTPRMRRGETTSFLAFLFFVLHARHEEPAGSSL